MTPIDFIKNILTDTYKDKIAMKVDALNVYTLLIQSNTEEAVLQIPFSDQILSIRAVDYAEVRNLYQAGQKIQAIKTLRSKSWMGSDKTATPSLLFSKTFVESLIPPMRS